MKKPYEAVYKRMKKQGFTDEEIADGMMIPPDMTKEEREESDKEMSKFIRERVAKMSSMSSEEKKLIEELSEKYKRENKKRKNK